MSYTATSRETAPDMGERGVIDGEGGREGELTEAARHRERVRYDVTLKGSGPKASWDLAARGLTINLMGNLFFSFNPKAKILVGKL
jgi:hypothetical protein